MTRGNLSLAVPLVALLVLVIGVVNEPQNAYAGFEEEPEDLTIWCNTYGDIERPGNFWTEGTCEIFVDELDIDFEFEVEIHGDLDLDGEGRCRDASTELTIFIDDYGFEGTIEIESEGESCRNRPVVNGEHEFTITGATGDFDFIVGGEGTLTTEMDRDRNFDIDIHGTLEVEIDSNQVVEVHCEVEYDWFKFIIFGEREGEGECVYIFEDESEQHEDVEIGGGFISFSGDLFGEFNIMDYEGNDIYLDEEGTIDVGCEFEGSDEPPRRHTPYCLETEMTVTGGSGLFDDLDGEGERTATGFFKSFFIFETGNAYSTIWIFFDCPECVPEEEETTKKSGGGCSNCQQPSIGVTERGNRVVDGGLTVNGNTIDADFYHTPYPLIHANIGQPIDFVFKIWDERADNIKHVQVQLGKNKIGESFNQVGSITWDRNVMTKIATVTHDPMFTNVHMDRHADQDCKVGGTPCTVIHLRFTPTQPIVGDVVFGVNIWDDGKNTVTSFFNDGLQIGTEADIIPTVDDTVKVVIKDQLRTDDGLGNIDKRYSDAFQMKLDWHNANIEKLVDQLGY